MANHKYCVYCHTNKITGMKYVGMTQLNPLHRWQKDGKGYDANNVFGKDIKKYGWENFAHEILEYGIRTREEAGDIEKRYIKELNTIYPNGYNSEDGGIHGSTNPARRDRIKRPSKGWTHTEDVKRLISDRLKESDTHPLSARIKKSKPVEMYDMNGNLVNTFYGAAEASRQTGISFGSICKAAKDGENRHKTAGGYIWKYKSA